MRRGALIAAAVFALGIASSSSAGERSGALEAKRVVSAYIRAERRGDWKTVCALKNPIVLRAAGGSIGDCAKDYPSLLNAGTGFLGFIRHGTATVRAEFARKAGPGRAEVFVLWRVMPWRRDAVQRFRLDRVPIGNKAPFRVSDEDWAPKQMWPPPKGQ